MEPTDRTFPPKSTSSGVNLIRFADAQADWHLVASSRAPRGSTAFAFDRSDNES